MRFLKDILTSHRQKGYSLTDGMWELSWFVTFGGWHEFLTLVEIVYERNTVLLFTDLLHMVRQDCFEHGMTHINLSFFKIRWGKTLKISASMGLKM